MDKAAKDSISFKIPQNLKNNTYKKAEHLQKEKKNS